MLESAPSRYDRGIRLLTLGRLNKAYDRLTSLIKQGQKVLDIGCGTGALTIRAALRGAEVKGIDINPQMLEIAKKRLNEANLAQNVKLCEMGVAELGSEEPESYDIVMSGLCFSELSEGEINYAVKEMKRILKSGGLLLIADEVVPKSRLKRVINCLVRLPLVAITYILTQTTTRAVRNLPEELRREGFTVESLRLSKMGNFMEMVAKKPEEMTK